ncbi:MAG: YkgJ family cysteine cluster protein [Bacillota bacterium]
MLPIGDIYSVLVYAENNGFFADLEKLYEGLPEKECTDCNNCCKNPPDASLLEYLYVFRYCRDNLIEQQAEVVKRAAEFFFLELVVPEQVCPFRADDSGCLVSAVRPLGCRLFGLVEEGDYERIEEERLERLRAFAEFLRTDHGIELPPAVISPRPHCDRYSGNDTVRVTMEQLDEYRMRLLVLDTSLVNPDLVFRRRTLSPLPLHLAISVLNAGVRAKRLDVLRAFLGGSRELLDKYVGRLAGYRF